MSETRIGVSTQKSAYPERTKLGLANLAKKVGTGALNYAGKTINAVFPPAFDELDEANKVLGEHGAKMTSNGDMVYFDGDGNKISKEQHKALRERGFSANR